MTVGVGVGEALSPRIGASSAAMNRTVDISIFMAGKGRRVGMGKKEGNPNLPACLTLTFFENYGTI